MVASKLHLINFLLKGKRSRTASQIRALWYSLRSKRFRASSSRSNFRAMTRLETLGTQATYGTNIVGAH